MKEKIFSLNSIMDEAKIRNINKILIFSHASHDGDAKGSSLSLKEYFKNKGFSCEYVITNEDFCLVDIFGKVDKYGQNNNENFIAISVDTATKAKCENNLFESADVCYKIDHHRYSEPFGDYNYLKKCHLHVK